MRFDSFVNDFAETIGGGSLIGFGLALVGGVISSGICPCTLPVGLGFAGYVGSSSVKESRSGILISFAFFSGIVICLTLLGGLAGYTGAFLTETFGKYWALVMGKLSLLAAVLAFYGPRLKVTQLESLRSPGIGGTFMYGFIFSLGTSAAPLILLLSVAAASSSIYLGMALALAFGIGRGLPFLLVGLFAGAVSPLARLSWLRKSIQWVSGLALLYVSFYFFSVFSVYL